MKAKLIICLLSIVPLLFSCEDYLDKSPEMGLTDIEVFSKYLSARGSLDKVYKLNEDFFNSGHAGSWFCIGDEGFTTASGSLMREIISGAYDSNSSNRELGWNATANMNSTATSIPIITMAFRNLRTVNICIERIDEIQDATQQQKNELLGQAYFFRAWNYFQLIRRWGGMFLIDHVYNSDSEIDLPRLTYHESTDWLASDLDKAFELLPMKWDEAQKGRVTKAAALALKEWALLYSASPLMCPEKGYTYDPVILKKALDASWEAINYIKTNNLHRLMPGSTADEYHSIFYNRTILASDEAIFYQIPPSGNRPISDWNANFVPNKMCAANVHCAAPTQNIVDLFEMKNGLSIKTPGSTYNDQNPYINRDPRFYYNIITNMEPWGLENGKPNYMELWEANTFDTKQSRWMQALYSTQYQPRNAYLIKKLWPETANVWQNDYNYREPSIYIRFTQLYLDFAEAANELYGPTTVVPGTTMSAVDAINLIRARVGAVPVRSEYTSSKELFRDRIRNERAVELMFETHRWHDIRRWRIAEDVLKTLNKVFITKTGETTFKFEYPLAEGYQITFKTKHYWYPIPRSDYEITDNVEQNPGW
jgi:starch-binding outer membrane protein, SusD/RagB family